MRFVRITTLYPVYVRSFYSSRPGLEQKNYAEQKAALEFDCFGWADYWATALRPLGYEAEELIADVPQLQAAWRLERGLPPEADPLDTLLSQLKEFRPEVLFVDDYARFTPNWLGRVREECPSLRLILGWCGAPFEDAGVFKAYDLVLSCIPELVEEFRRLGHESVQMHHAFDSRVLDRLASLPVSPLDFSFIGQVVRGGQFHGQREILLRALVSRLPLTICSPASEVDWSDDLRFAAKAGVFQTVRALRAAGIPEGTLARIPVVRKAARWKRAPVSQRLRGFGKRLRPGVFGLEMFRTLRDSNVTLNTHIDASRSSASNMRLFEATGAGACLLTDWKENIRDLFEPDSEVVTYRSVDECVEKARWLLDHPAERKAIAQAGQARTLRDHGFRNRAQVLDKLIKERI